MAATSTVLGWEGACSSQNPLPRSAYKHGGDTTSKEARIRKKKKDAKTYFLSFLLVSGSARRKAGKIW
jgi:hypothetical protein